MAGMGWGRSNPMNRLFRVFAFIVVLVIITSCCRPTSPTLPTARDAAPALGPAAVRCMTSVTLKNNGCEEHAWTPGPDFLAVLELFRDPLRRHLGAPERAVEAFNQCRATNEFCAYGLALAAQFKGDVALFRQLAATYLQNARADCIECRVIALRDIGISLILQEPTDFGAGQEKLLEACALAADPRVFLPGHVHPCALLSSQTADIQRKQKRVDLFVMPCTDMLLHSCDYLHRNEPHIDLVWW